MAFRFLFISNSREPDSRVVLMTLNANTNPEDVISISTWTTRTAVREKLHAKCEWHPDALTGTPGLGFIVLELTRDCGLEDHLRGYADHLEEVAKRLICVFSDYGERYARSVKFCERVHTLLSPENGGTQMLCSATLDIESAINDALYVGEPTRDMRHPDWDDVIEAASAQSLAAVLITTLQAKRLL